MGLWSIVLYILKSLFCNTVYTVHRLLITMWFFISLTVPSTREAFTLMSHSVVKPSVNIWLNQLYIFALSVSEHLLNRVMLSNVVVFSFFCCSSGLLPNAVLPPSLDHNYAQWQEREEMACAEHHLSMKIIPAPCSKAPGEPDFPIVPPPPPPQHAHGEEQKDTPHPPNFSLLFFSSLKYVIWHVISFSQPFLFHLSPPPNLLRPYSGGQPRTSPSLWYWWQ